MYRFSPADLDQFQRYLESEQEFESDFNYSEDGGYKKSLEEIVSEREQELINSLNRVPQEPIFAAARGTAFNEAVDMAIECRSQSTNKNVSCVTFGAVYEMVCEGFTFKFDGQLVASCAAVLREGTMQMHVATTLHTEMGDVILHGYPDYIMPDNVSDLKTTENYTWGKYVNKWQRYAFPFILLSNGLMQKCDYFDFLVVEMKADRKTGIIGGNLYHETYTDITMDKCQSELQWITSGLIMFVEDHKDQITNPKIFNK